jgi:diacylglycerol kinase (ATP)
MNPDKFSLKSRLQSFRFALNGLRSLLKYEHNSRIHSIAAIAVIILGLLLKIDLTEWSLLIIVMGIVFITELLNSSLESFADSMKPEWNDMIGKAKDYSAAAVLIAAIISLAVGVFIFAPKLLGLI